MKLTQQQAIMIVFLWFLIVSVMLIVSINFLINERVNYAKEITDDMGAAEKARIKTITEDITKAGGKIPPKDWIK